MDTLISPPPALSTIITKVAAITASAFLAGSTATYSFLWVPSIRNAPEHIIASQWRIGYRIGFYATVPQCALCALLWAYLAFTAPAGSRARMLYTTAAIIVPSILPYTLTVQRAVNGALDRRAERLAGPGTGSIAETYSRDEKRSKEFGEGESTTALVESWGRYNMVRAMIVVLGTACGAWAAVSS
ncbi:hypothetical protein W97_06159 [Coniosporium apollinis CBS 100218]|uniref:DUF1772 domain-containing protein n=1 Tax=Coniosporium apollinis (strain CBS 100218) TaxID=1168221 RepID=R7YYR6_CONA1|nr:uncharacterized protein W97_06159 [Coniosporium apollinis CBS 100218]EON67042.1 hypothetical protein W97_06159 [Coniosporium apollinis CBS 100218]